MADLPPTLLVRRDQKLHWALAVSALLHVAGFGGALIASRAGANTPRIDQDLKPIAARLVRLGEERDRNLLPRRETTPPPPPPPAQAAPPAPVVQPPPTAEPVQPAAPVVPSITAPPEPAPQAKAPDPRPETSERSEPADLDEIMRQFRGPVDPDARHDDGPIYGSPDGDPYGDAAEAGEGDIYLALVTRALRENYRVPNIINERERMFLNATIIIYVASDGRITRHEIESPSGNPHFDAALIRAVEASSPLPPPPRGWAARFEREGLGLNFRL